MTPDQAADIAEHLMAAHGVRNLDPLKHDLVMIHQEVHKQRLFIDPPHDFHVTVGTCPCGSKDCPGGGFVDDQHCWFHGWEPQPGDAYVICGECGHVYETAMELELAVFELVGQDRLAKDISACGLCAHSF